MAQVTARKRGKTWCYRFETAPIGGKRQQVEKSGFHTKKDALKAGNLAMQEYENVGKQFKPSEMSYADLVSEWLNKHCPLVYDKTTIESYTKDSRLHILPSLGKYRVSSLDTIDFQVVIAQKFKEGYSLNRLSVIKNIMSLTMKYAKRMGYIKYNPMYEVKLPSQKAAKNNPKTRKKERKPIPREVINQIFKRFPEGHSAHIPMMLGYKAGLRLGEAFALTWEDIDLKNGIIHVRRQIQSGNKKGEYSKLYFKGCKYDSERDLPIDQQLVNLLRRELIRQKENRLYYGEHYARYFVNKQSIINQESGREIYFVNVSENGSYNQPRIMQHTSAVIHGTAKCKTGKTTIWKDFDFHSLRHTHGTELASAGLSAKEIQIRLGHKNIETTLNIYVHDTPDMQEHTRQSLEELYQKAQ